MTNYLGRLVERARGGIPRVEPLTTPRFARAEPPMFESPPEDPARPARTRADPACVPEVPSKDALPPVLKGPEFLLIPSHHGLRTASAVPHKYAGPEPPGGAVSPRREVRPPEPEAKRARPVQPAASAPPEPWGATEELPEVSGNPAPIVNIRIGRIEVRADPTSAPPPRKTARAPEPRLSLDAYLKARREGAR